MQEKLSLLEEIDIRESIREPHLSYMEETMQERKKVSYSILKRSVDDILLIDSSGFLIDSVFAGLTEKHIEHLGKNAPKNYKENLLKIQENRKMMQGAFEISKDMDKDLGENITQNQQRIKNVIQYIKDNQIAFEFQNQI